jgi:photosystem II stability/assembly factor-like uncharacterized protein
VTLSPTRWAAIGPASIQAGVGQAGLNSGRLTGIAADPTNANVIYIAAAGGGVWKTTNAGTSWTPLTDNMPTLFMGSIAVAPSAPNIVYAGSGESNNSADCFYGRGIYKTNNGGASWRLLGGSIFNGASIAKIVVDPNNPNLVYVAVAGDPENGFPSGNVGVWKSTNGGDTWTNTTISPVTGIPGYDHDNGEISDLVMDPNNHQTLYAADGPYAGDAASGIYKTTNGGATWAPAGNAPTGPDLGRIALAIGPDSSVYAAITASGNGSAQFGTLYEMVKSTDGGATWNQLPAPDYLHFQGWYDTTLAVDPLHANTVYAGGTLNFGAPGFIRSTDGGQTWTDISVGANGNGIHTDDHALAFDAQDRLLDGNDGGIWRLENTTDGSILWSDLNSNLQITQFGGIALDPSNINTVYGGSQDNGTEKFTGSPVWNQVFGNDGGFVRVDFTNPNVVFQESQDISLQRSTDGGMTWNDATSGINYGDPHNFYVPYVMDPSNSSRLLLGTDRVYESTDSGQSWTAITAPGANGWNSSSPIDALAVAKSDPNTIYVSTGGLAGEFGSDHHIFVTHDGGATWQQTDVPGFNDRFPDITVDPTNSMVAYTTRDVFNTGPDGHVFKTTDGGADWVDISGNLPNVPVKSIILDPRSGDLFAGTDIGVYASSNGGTTWARLGEGLPNVCVFDMDFNAGENVLAVGTHGRGAWEIATTHLLVTSSTSLPMAGVPFTITVTAQDAFNNTMTGYSGTIHFTDSRQGVLPADYTFQPGDHGTKTFTIVLVTPGRQAIWATDTINNAVTGMVEVTVRSAAGPDLSILTNSAATASVASQQAPASSADLAATPRQPMAALAWVLASAARPAQTIGIDFMAGVLGGQHDPASALAAGWINPWEQSADWTSF